MEYNAKLVRIKNVKLLWVKMGFHVYIENRRKVLIKFLDKNGTFDIVCFGREAHRGRCNASKMII